MGECVVFGVVGDVGVVARRRRVRRRRTRGRRIFDLVFDDIDG